MVWSFFDIKQYEKVNGLEIEIRSFDLHLQLKKETNNFKFFSSPIGPIPFLQLLSHPPTPVTSVLGPGTPNFRKLTLYDNLFTFSLLSWYKTKFLL